MKNSWKSWALRLLPILLLNGCGERQETAQKPESRPGSTVATIKTPARAVRLQLDVAADATAQEKGLAGRKTLAAGSGMVFPLDPPRTISFWMKDMLIPLDLLFVRSDGTIAAILPGKPGDMTPISTGEPVRGVIEIGHGEAARLGISPNDRVSWGDCGDTGKRDPLRFCPT